MDLATMRTALVSKLGLAGGSDFPEAELDRHLNRIWRFEIPNRLSSAAVRSLRSFSTVSGQDTYDVDVLFPGEIRAIQKPIFADDRLLDFHSHPEVFWANFLPSSITEGTPTAALVDGRTIVLRAVPTVGITIRFQAIQYRVELGAAGVVDEIEAAAVVNGAAELLAADVGMDEIASKYQGLFEADLPRLNHKYGANDESIPPSQADF